MVSFEEQYGWAPDSDYEVLKTNDPDGSKYRKMLEKLTVAQAKELNEAAKWYCDHEVTAEGVE